jgi:hypothetical protein
VTAIVEDIVENWIAPFSPISYVPSLIGPASGTVTASTIELGKFSIRQVLDTLAQMAVTDDYYYIWGVSGDGNFYWERIEFDSRERTFFIGYNLHEFQPKINYENVRNVITVQRQQGRGSGGAGWAVAGVYNNDSSVKKYGRNELNYQIPGFFSDSDADLVGNALISDLAEPDTSAQTGNWQARNQLEYLTNGIYRFIMPLSRYTETVNDVDDASEWDIVATGDLTAEDEDTVFVFADGGVKFTAQNASGQRAEIDIEAEGLIREVRFYVRSNQAGAGMTVGVGGSAWNEVTTTLDVPIADTFVPFRWDVSDLNIRTLGKFAIRIDEDFTAERQIYIDKIDVVFSGHKTYNLQL